MDEYGQVFNAAVAAELRAERVRVKISYGQLVEQTGFSKSALLHYLNGQRDIPVPALILICRVLKVDATKIFDRASRAVDPLADE